MILNIQIEYVALFLDCSWINTPSLSLPQYYLNPSTKPKNVKKELTPQMRERTHHKLSPMAMKIQVMYSMPDRIRGTCYFFGTVRNFI